MSEKLLLLVKDGDFYTNGVTIRRMRDLTKIRLEDGTVNDMSDEENPLQAPIPTMELTNWTTVFTAFYEQGCVAIVEREKMGRKDGSYAIGRIEKVGNKTVKIAYYGPDSSWEGKTWKLPYEEITRVTVSSRYTEVLSRYLPKEENGPVKEAVLAGTGTEE